MATVVCSSLDVKSWMVEALSVSAARPARCPECGCCGRADGRVHLHGHGTRERCVVGPLGIGERPAEYVVVLRRYRCQQCGCVVEVVPVGLLPKRRYGLVAIVLSLVAWAIDGESAWRVRRRCSPQCRFGDGTVGRWPVLRRWARRVADLFVGFEPRSDAPRAVASEVVRWLVAHAHCDAQDASLAARALAGAVRVTAPCA